MNLDPRTWGSAGGLLEESEWLGTKRRQGLALWHFGPTHAEQADST